MSGRPALRVGPMLRWTDTTSATVWAETDRPGTVTVHVTTAEGERTHEARTFTVRGHHYAIVTVTGLAEGTEHPYRVTLDGADVWPTAEVADLPAPVIPTHSPDDRWRITFGSCRHISDIDEDPHPDALRVLAERVSRTQPPDRPDLLLMLGDQVYACKVSSAMREFMASRRDLSAPPGDEVADFTEFAELYREAFAGDPAVRWLLSTVPTAMVFDDHDVIDDWNISADWVADMRKEPWWHDRITGGLMAYWLYQHLGNLSPERLAAEPLLAELLALDGDGGDLLERAAVDADRDAPEEPGSRWGFTRDLGGVRLVVVDSRNGRTLEPGARDMLDDRAWAWVDELVRGDVDHLLLASSVPFLLPKGIHYAEAWSEEVCEGAWGRLVARAGEALRRAADLEHWAAFRTGFARIARLLGDVAEGRRGRPPSSVLLLSGDVHYVYTARARTGPGQQSAVWQLTCSPMHYEMEPPLRALMRTGVSTVGTAIGRGLRRSVQAAVPDLDWEVTDRPQFGSFLATLTLDGPHAEIVFEEAGTRGLRPRIRRTLTS